MGLQPFANISALIRDRNSVNICSQDKGSEALTYFNVRLHERVSLSSLRGGRAMADIATFIQIVIGQRDFFNSFSE
jgi:hypothetical protein